MATGFFEVQFDFDGEDEGELSVRVGEIVVLDQSAEEEDEGWSAVIVNGDPSRRGVVPSQYISPIEEQAAPAVQPVEEAPDTHQPHASPEDDLAEPRDESDDFRQQYDDHFQPAASPQMDMPPAGDVPSPREASFGMAGSARQSPSSAAAHALVPHAQAAGGVDAGAGEDLADSDEFSHLFAAHEEWFQQAMARRADTFRQIQGAVGELTSRLVECDSRNTDIVKRLGELEGIIEAERSKWQDRWQAEQEAALAPTD